MKPSDRPQQAAAEQWLLRGILAMLVLASGTSCAPAPSTEQVREPPSAAMPTPAAKSTLMDHQRKIDSNLLRAIEDVRGNTPAASPVLATVATNADGTVDVAVRAMVSDALVAQIEALGATVTYTNAPLHTIQARAPLDTLEPIARLPEVRFIVPKPQAFTNPSDAPPLPGASDSPQP